MDMAAINAMLQTPNMQMGGLQDALGTDTSLQGLFAMLFGQMLGQTEGEDPTLGTLFSSMQDETDDTQLRLAMEMMASTLTGGSQAVEMLLGQTENNAALDSIMQTTQTQSLLLEQLQAQLALAEQQAATQADSKVHDTDWDTLLNTLTTAWEETSEEDKSAVPTHELDQVQFASAVRQVRDLLAEKPREVKEETRQPLDVEALQAVVDSRQYVPDTVSVRQETPDVREIADQLKTGILDNLRQGKNEFVVKLKPEGLGEITVKLTESKNEISLRIVTSSAAVGRMIANDVNALQNALRPLRAQVQEIVTVPAAQENAAGTMLTGGQGEQQFAWHYQNQQQSQQSGGRAHAEEGGDFEDLVEEIAPDDANVNLLI